MDGVSSENSNVGGGKESQATGIEKGDFVVLSLFQISDSYSVFNLSPLFWGVLLFVLSIDHPQLDIAIIIIIVTKAI